MNNKKPVNVPGGPAVVFGAKNMAYQGASSASAGAIKSAPGVGSFSVSDNDSSLNDNAKVAVTAMLNDYDAKLVKPKDMISWVNQEIDRAIDSSYYDDEVEYYSDLSHHVENMSIDDFISKYNYSNDTDSMEDAVDVYLYNSSRFDVSFEENYGDNPEYFKQDLRVVMNSVLNRNEGRSYGEDDYDGETCFNDYLDDMEEEWENRGHTDNYGDTISDIMMNSCNSTRISDVKNEAESMLAKLSSSLSNKADKLVGF